MTLDKIIAEIKEWIEEETTLSLHPQTLGCNRSFDEFITMADGRKAQVKVMLEMDEEEWDY